MLFVALLKVTLLSMKWKTFRKHEHTLDKHWELVANNTNTPDPNVFNLCKFDPNIFTFFSTTFWCFSFRGEGLTELKRKKTPSWPSFERLEVFWGTSLNPDNRSPLTRILSGTKKTFREEGKTFCTDRLHLYMCVKFCSLNNLSTKVQLPSSFTFVLLDKA